MKIIALCLAWLPSLYAVEPQRDSACREIFHPNIAVQLNDLGFKQLDVTHFLKEQVLVDLGNEQGPQLFFERFSFPSGWGVDLPVRHQLSKLKFKKLAEGSVFGLETEKGDWRALGEEDRILHLYESADLHKDLWPESPRMVSLRTYMDPLGVHVPRPVTELVIDAGSHHLVLSSLRLRGFHSVRISYPQGVRLDELEERFDLQPPQPIGDDTFQLYAVNDPGQILKLQTINGQSVESIEVDLNEDVRPGKVRQDFIPTLAQDHDQVQKWNLTHTDLVRPVKALIALWQLHEMPFDITLEGINYRVDGVMTLRNERAFSTDEAGVSWDAAFRIVRLDEGESLFISTNDLDRIEKYGWYGFKRKNTRKEPKVFRQLFPFLKPRS